MNFKKDIALALAFTALGLWVSWESFSYSYQSSVFLRGLAITLVVMSIILLTTRLSKYRHVVTAADDSSPFIDKKDTRQLVKALLVFGLVGGYILAITLVGFLFATFLFVYIAMCSFSGKHRTLYLVYSAALSLAIFMLFFNALGVTLPDSLLPIDNFFEIV